MELDGDRCFVTDDGKRVEVMGQDLGYRSGSGRMYQEGYGQIPESGWSLATGNFRHEFRAMRRAFRRDEWHAFEEAVPQPNILSKGGRWLAGSLVGGLSAIDSWLEAQGVLGSLDKPETEREEQQHGSSKSLTLEVRQKLASLKLSDRRIMVRTRRREAVTSKIQTAWYVNVCYSVLCFFLDVVYAHRPIQRFWLLEEVARMPYFSYVSMLHLYETLGWWRAGADLRKIHFAEEWNEMHHLQIMECLGGDALWFDRFIAAHAAIVYYWLLLLLFWVKPEAAYTFSEMLESHAVDTYGEFVDENEKTLKGMPPPLVALQYYRGSDLYMFDEFQTSKRVKPRRPPCRNLYDVFSNIRDDEGEHVTTMHHCRMGDIFETPSATQT